MRKDKTSELTDFLTAANKKRLKLYRDNADIIAGIQWLATLDLRTCPECAKLDRLCWTLDGVPLGHNIPFVSPPLHPACRCTLLPVTKMFTKIENGQVIDLTTFSTRASMNGQVSSKLTFIEWFHSLPQEQQEEYFKRHYVNKKECS